MLLLHLILPFYPNLLKILMLKVINDAENNLWKILEPHLKYFGCFLFFEMSECDVELMTVSIYAVCCIKQLKNIKHKMNSGNSKCVTKIMRAYSAPPTPHLICVLYILWKYIYLIYTYMHLIYTVKNSKTTWLTQTTCFDTTFNMNCFIRSSVTF